MNTGDSITIWGDAEGSQSGKKAFGASINEAAVIEDYLTDSTSGYSDTGDPNPS
jgi:hypothetical protein